MGLLVFEYKANIPKWFTFRLATNTSTLILIITAFILIFVEFNGFVPSVHSYLGVLVFSMGLIQGKKPKFWPDKLHWILGYLFKFWSGWAIARI